MFGKFIAMPTRYNKMTPLQKKMAQARTKKWKEKNKESVAASKKKHYMKHRSKFLHLERVRIYKKLYGITIEDYNRMFAEQDGKCAICKSDESIKGEIRQFFTVDHCHKTGVVRGLLCIACNSLLGRYEKYENEIQDYLYSEKKFLRKVS
jgi:hypothetical protein